MLVQRKEGDDPKVHEIACGFVQRMTQHALHYGLKYGAKMLHQSANPVLHSDNLIGLPLSKAVECHAPDLVHLHWLSDHFVSIGELARIQRPTVWTLHDMWAFSGAEHYDDLEHPGRYQEGYHANNRRSGDGGLDLDRYVWQRKRKHWTHFPDCIVAPTSWLAACAKRSALFADRSVEVIPNALPMDQFAPGDMQQARRYFNLPEDRPIILSGAAYEGKVKGMHLLVQAWEQVMHHYETEAQQPKPMLVLFGAHGMANTVLSNREDVRFLGRLDDKAMVEAYRAADVMVVPSMLEAFGQTASEAQACGVPVIAFDNSGLTDIVIDGETGWLVPAFDVSALSRQIITALAEPDRRKTCGEKAHKQAKLRFSYEVVASQYKALYQRLLEH